ncbi:MAG: type II toxin-antitoxin system VapC family toxin [Bdellovibrionota bacterium]
MLYWDSSALVASLLAEERTGEVRSFAARHGDLRSYTAILTPLEVESAIQRRLKERSLSPQQAARARLLAIDFRKRTYLATADQDVLDGALHLQKIYGLRPGDAVQLASARAGTGNPSTVHFLCLDEELNDAARQEGFNVPL